MHSLVPGLQWFTNLFPVWTILAGAVGVLRPEWITWMKGPFITYGLALIMLGMGLTLRVEDFRRAAQRPGLVFLGVALQYSVMPLCGFLLARAFALPPEFAVGLMLTACCPGGTASNVIAFLARADLGLSVSMTAVSTLLAALATPALTWLLVGDLMDVSPIGLFQDTLQVVIVPVLLGLLINRYLGGAARYVLPFAPPVAVIAIALIVGSVLGARRDDIFASGFALIGAVLALHLAGFGLGYWIARAFAGIRTARTASIEVGMQNSGLAVELARSNFPGTAADVSGAISAMTHCIIGSAAAAVWRLQTPDASELASEASSNERAARNPAGESENRMV